MGWPDVINIADERTAYVDLTRVETAPKEMWTAPGAYGGTRRKRIKPETLSVYWSKRIRDLDWSINRVTVSGRYIHSQSNSSMWIYLDEIPEWARTLIDQTDPRKEQSGE